MFLRKYLRGIHSNRTYVTPVSKTRIDRYRRSWISDVQGELRLVALALYGDLTVTNIATPPPYPRHIPLFALPSLMEKPNPDADVL